jgi:ABC-type transporter Mla subunit MlaD
MKTIQQIFVCALLAALTAVAVSAVRVLNAIPAEMRATRAALVGEVEAARCDLNSQLGSLAARSERQIAALRKDTLAEVDQIRQTADRRTVDMLARADVALGTLEATRRDLEPTLANSAAISAQVNDALPLFLDCDHNADCMFNRYVGASKGIERAAMNFGQASADVRSVVPQMLATWNQIGVGVAGTAANLDRLTKPHWYDRLLGYVLNGVVIYRNLNPATNLTVTGAQFLSGRP